MKVFLVLSLLCSLPALAQEFDARRDWDVETYYTNQRLYRAEGEHQCQSHSSLGHRCETVGINFTDCNNAFLKLQRQDCCGTSRYGGVSIGFRMTRCSALNLWD